MSTIFHGYLASIGPSKISSNDTNYNNIVQQTFTGFQFQSIRVVLFENIADVKLFSLGDKVTLELEKCGSFWNLIGIQKASFTDCSICKAPHLNLYDAMNCKGCNNIVKNRVTGLAEIVDLETREYISGPGLKVTLKVDEKTYYFVSKINSMKFTRKVSLFKGKFPVLHNKMLQVSNYSLIS